MDLLSTGSDSEDRPILSHRSEPKSGKEGKELWSLMIGEWRLTEELPVGSLELYNLSQDPTQQHDLAAAHPARVGAMSARLTEIKDSLAPLPRNQVQVDLTYRLNMELKRLGYAGGDDE
jgi:hypothetical protein